jgi:hypothetical protein
VKHATESVDEFRARINQAARDEEEGAPGGGGEEWLLGTLRDRGSLHADLWSGIAADLAEREAIGIFPVGGKKSPTWSASMRWLGMLWSSPFGRPALTWISARPWKRPWLSKRQLRRSVASKLRGLVAMAKRSERALTEPCPPETSA